MWMPTLLAAFLTLSDTTITPCDGRRIDTVSVNAQRPEYRGTANTWRTFAHAIGLHHITTRVEVSRAFSYVHPGDICSARELAETERVLRSLPFLADARVSAHPIDSLPGSAVAVDIETTDEVPVLATAALRHSVPSALSIGNENLFGSGISTTVGGADNSPYRSSAFATVSAYGLLGDLTLTSIDAGRDPLGDHLELVASQLLLSDLQRFAWNATYRHGDDFPILVRPVGDDQSVEVHDERWSLAAIVRANIGPTSVLAGPVALGNQLSPAATSLLVSDAGPVPERDTALIARFRPYHAVRLGALVGARSVRFVTRTGYDALFAPQDLMVGWQIGTLAAPGFSNSAIRDLMIAPSIYVGGTTRRSALLADIEAESRRVVSSNASAETIANLHATAYFKPDSHVLFSVNDYYSTIDGAALPTQLALSDPLGGVRGFASSTIVGGRRNVLRLEARTAWPALVKRADLGIGVFADHGWMMSNGVPYGQNASAQSVGLSLIGSYPTRSKRAYRVDIAFPVGGSGARGVQVRFVNSDPTSTFGVEPADVTQARLAPVPSTLFTWPGR
jgi:hypothetical protein